MLLFNRNYKVCQESAKLRCVGTTFDNFQLIPLGSKGFVVLENVFIQLILGGSLGLVPKLKYVHYFDTRSLAIYVFVIVSRIAGWVYLLQLAFLETLF